MKNADLPAMPQALTMNNEEGYTTSDFYGHSRFNGLTKREMFAMHAMQGLLANSYGNSWSAEQIVSMLSKQSVEFADALLGELEK